MVYNQYTTLGIIFYLLLCPLSSRADVFNKWIFPFGDKSSLVANTGIADETSMGLVFFNPGALSKTKGSKVSLSGSLYYTYNLRLDGLNFIDNTLIPYEATGFNTIPSTVVSTFHLFDEVIAFSILIPHAMQVESTGIFTTPNMAGAIIPKVSERELWVGLTGSRALSEKWGLGVSLYGVQYTNSIVTSTGVRISLAPNTVVNSMQKVAPTIYGVVCIVGAHYTHDPNTSLGVRLQTPFWQVSGSAEAYQFMSQTSSGTVTNFLEDKRTTPAKYDIPWDVGLGVTHRFNERWKVLADVTYAGAVDYKNLPEVPLLTDQYVTQGGPRYSLGVERRMTDKITAHLGYGFIPSTIRDLNARSAGRIKADVWTLTGGVNWTDDKVSTGLGFMYMEGYGNSLISGPPVTRVGARITAMGLVLATNYVF